MVWTSYVSSRCQSYVKKAFGWIGSHAHTHPFTNIAIGVLFTWLSAIGMLNYSYESNALHLYVPQDSEIYQQYLQSKDYFGEFTTTGVLVIKEKDGNNLFTPETLNILWMIYQNVSDAVETDDKDKYRFDDLCEREYPTYPVCQSDESNMFYLWGNDPENWSTQTLVDTYLASDDGQDLLQFLVGDHIYSGDGSTIIGGTYIRLIWFLTGTTDDDIFDANYEWMLAFQDYMDDNKDDYKDMYNFEITYFTSRSLEDEIDRIVVADAPVFLMAVIVMFTFLAFTLGSFTCMGARPWLAVVTINVMFMALMISFGLGNAVGLPTTSLNMLVPYVLLGVGVDDEIIIIEAVDRTPYPKEDLTRGAERFELALQHSGLSITLTSLCSVMAFFIGAISDIPAVESFCVYAAIGFFANYVLQFLIFLPLLALDEKRKLAGRNFCCWCVKHENFDTSSIGHVDDVAEETDNSDLPLIQRISKFGVTDVLEYTLLPVLSNFWARIGIILLFLGILIASIVGLPSLNLTSDLTHLVPDDSFVIDYFDEFRKGFGESVYTEVSLVFEDLDFSDSEVRDKVQSIMSDFEAYAVDDAFAIGSVENWLDAFEEYVNGTGSTVNSLSSSEFYSHLQTFANTSTNQRWNDELIYDDDENPTKIEATKFYIDFVQPDSNVDTWPIRKDCKQIYKEYLGEKNGYPYEVLWPFAYFEYNVLGLTIRNIITASIGVFVVLAFLMDLRMAVFIILIVVMIDLILFGWIVITGLALDSLAFIQLVMAVGLTVDYVIHITHAIADAPSPTGDDGDYNGKLRVAMLDMGVGVAKGAFTTFLGAIPLSGSQSEAFRRFFYLFAGIILIALAHGLIFVPAVMANIPWLYSGIEHASSEADKSLGVADAPHTGRALSSRQLSVPDGQHVRNDTESNATELGGRTGDAPAPEVELR